MMTHLRGCLFLRSGPHREGLWRVVSRRLARKRPIDPRSLGFAHVQVHEAAIRVIAATGVSERSAKRPDVIVFDPLDLEVERAAKIVIRVRRKLRWRVGSVTADDI